MSAAVRGVDLRTRRRWRVQFGSLRALSASLIVLGWVVSVVEPGEFEIFVGASSRDADLLRVTLRAE